MTALLLRIIACIAMLIDHIGYQYGIGFFRQLGRIAFPIFVFLIANGYQHTASKLRYALRLGLFALISQIPFSLFSENLVWINHGNVFVTLFLSLICIWTADTMLRKKALRYFAFLPTILISLLYYFKIISSDYGVRGIIYAFVFLYFIKTKKSNSWILVVGMLVAIYYSFILSLVKWFVLGGAATFPTLTNWQITQAYSLFALPLIIRYNGKKGRMPQSPLMAKLSQLGFYIFYPAHMLVLWLIRIL